jgi:hypothetical protein
MGLDLENKNGIIILSNVSAFNEIDGNIDQLMFELIQTLYETPSLYGFQSHPSFPLNSRRWFT